MGTTQNLREVFYVQKEETEVRGEINEQVGKVIFVVIVFISSIVIIKRDIKT